MKDYLQRFLFEDHDVKGAVVRLDQSIDQIMEQHAYPKSVRLILSQVLAASTMLMSTLKLEGQITLQFQNKGALRLLVAKCSSNYDIRGMANWDYEALPSDFLKNFEEGDLIITLEDFANDHRYQSIIPLVQGSVSNAIELYFSQSDQLPTLVKIFVTPTQTFGFFLQKLPTQIKIDSSYWNELILFTNTISEKDFIDSPENQHLLQKLFNEYSIRLFDPTAVQFNCTCSYDKMENTIKMLGRNEADAILSTQRFINITCDYCNNSYEFSKAGFDGIFNVH